MRLDRLHLRNVGPFADADIDLTALPEDARLIAVTGPNGAGKSTFLGAWAGAIYRAAPRIPNLTSIATARDSMIEATVVNGSTWTLRQMLDGIARKSEALVLDGDGAAVLENTKLRTFDSWVAGHIMPAEVFYASIFGAQGAGGFIEAKPADRKAILCRVLGIEHLEAVAERCREEARKARALVETTEARLADERARGGDVEQVQTDLIAAMGARDRADDDLTEARRALDGAVAEAARITELVAEARRIEEQRTAIEQRRSVAAAKVRDLIARVTNNRAILERADEIREAVAQVERLDEEIARADQRLAEIAAENGRRDVEARALRDRRAAVEGEQQRATMRATEHRKVLAARERIEQAARDLPALTEAVEQAGATLGAKRAELAAEQEQRVASYGDRIIGLRDGLAYMADNPAMPVGGAADHARGVLATDDAAVLAAKEVPKIVERITAERDELVRALDQATRRAEAARLEAARLPEIERAAAGLATAEQEAQLAREQLDRLTAEMDQVASMVPDAEERKARGLLVAERTRQAETAKLAGPLAQAEARIEELAPQLAEADGEVAKAELDLIDLPAPPEIPGTPDVAGARRAVEQAEATARATAARVPALEDALKRAEASAVRVAELEAELEDARARHADWTRLAADCGRDGLQAIEIDAAGPELGDLVNDLLHASHGSRWSVKVETTRLSSDGKRELEGLEITVLDTEAGREAPADEFSGGERVFLGEAVSLALSCMACRRAGIEAPTLARDESGAALDPANGRAYIAMLRRAADIVGARHVLYVSHTPELQELADARIVVGGGTAVVA